MGAVLLALASAALLHRLLPGEVAREYALVRFYIPWDDDVESATSVSYWLASWDRRIERVVVGEDGRFYAGGRRIRFFGVNIGGAACFPEKGEAERVAARLAKLGVNLVRLHGIDANWESVNIFGGYGAPTTRTIDPKALDRLDYFIAKLRERGIYVNLNLLVARRFRAADGLHPDVEKLDWKDQHALIFIDPSVRALYKEFVYQLLTHRNPYTNMTHAEDPAVAFVEIANEMGAWFWYMLTDLVARLPPHYKGLLEDLWNSYLMSKYGTIEGYLERWGVRGGRAPALTSSMYWSAPDFVREDWLDFIYRLELETYSELYDFIRREVGYGGIIVGSTTFFSPLSIQSRFDVIDAHSYWQHPEFPGQAWDPGNWYVLNEPMVNHPLKSTIVALAAQRVHGKPFVVSEYGHPAPNMYAPEGIVMLAAYAALQDWDGIVYFAYGAYNDWDARRIRGWFDIDQDPLKMALMLPAYMLFVRGDVKPAQGYIVADLPGYVERRLLKEYNYGEGSDVGLKPEAALTHRVAVAIEKPPPSGALKPEDFKPPAERGVYASDTGQIVWDASREGRGLLQVVTDRSIVLAGYIGGGRFEHAGVAIEVGETLLDGWGIVSLIARADETIANWSRVLLIAMGYGVNEGMTIRDYDSKRVVAVGSPTMKQLGEARGKRIFCPFQWGQRGDWGPGPTLVEPLSLTVRLRVSRSIEVWALDTQGRRAARVPVAEEGSWKVFRVDHSYGTIWYEILTNP